MYIPKLTHSKGTRATTARDCERACIDSDEVPEANAPAAVVAFVLEAVPAAHPVCQTVVDHGVGGNLTGLHLRHGHHDGMVQSLSSGAAAVEFGPIEAVLAVGEHKSLRVVIVALEFERRVVLEPIGFSAGFSIRLMRGHHCTLMLDEDLFKCLPLESAGERRSYRYSSVGLADPSVLGDLNGVVGCDRLEFIANAESFASV